MAEEAPIAGVGQSREAFIPGRTPYLGQTVLLEPARHNNVLLRTGDHRDENSIRRGHA
jgi:hypothetical protein